MASIADARASVRAFQRCSSESLLRANETEEPHSQRNTETKCQTLRNDAAQYTSQAISRECHPQVEAFHRCFKHRFELEGCDDAVTTNLLNCQQRLTLHIVNPKLSE